MFNTVYGRRHLKPFTNRNILWDILYMIQDYHKWWVFRNDCKDFKCYFFLPMMVQLWTIQIKKRMYIDSHGRHIYTWVLWLLFLYLVWCCIFRPIRKFATLHFWPMPNPLYYTSDLIARGFTATIWTCDRSARPPSLSFPRRSVH